METKANYMLVGICAILAVLITAGIVLFSLGKNNGGQDTLYVVNFNGGVFGLSVGNAVLYNGVRVGTVRQISLAPGDQSVVRVLLEVDGNTPVREDCTASQHAMGITGQSAIYITGGSPRSPVLKPDPGEAFAVIPTVPSAVDQFLREAPNLLASANQFLDLGSKMLSPENAENLRQSLAAISAFSNNLAAHSRRLDGALVSLNQAATNLSRLLVAGEQFIDNDLADAGRSAERAFSRIENLAGRATPAAEKISQINVNDFNRLTNEIRLFIRSLGQSLKRMEADPTRFIFGDSIPEHSLPK